MDLKNFISDRRTTSLLLMGKNGLSMKEDALALARHLLTSENIDNHPDFVYVSSEDGKQLKVEDILPLIERSTTAPAIASKIVAIIDGMDRLTIAAQNKLLILLESNPITFIIGVSYGGSVLDTVKSRMRIVEYHSLNREDFLRECGLEDIEGTVLYYATNGCLSLLQDLGKEKQMFLDTYNIISSGKDLHRLLSALHLVKEKDTLSVCRDKKLMLAVMRVMQYAFHCLMVSSFENSNYKETCNFLEIEDMLYDEELRCSNLSVYGSADFFNLITHCIESVQRKES